MPVLHSRMPINNRLHKAIPKLVRFFCLDFPIPILSEVQWYFLAIILLKLVSLRFIERATIAKREEVKQWFPTSIGLEGMLTQLGFSMSHLNSIVKLLTE